MFKQYIRTIPNYPKSGINFKDITTLLKSPKVFIDVVDLLATKYKDKGIDKVVGIESRGFIFGSALAYAIGAGFVPIRKKGKLPANVISETYDLEYGSDTLEIHIDAIEKGDSVLVVDDLLATGGTALAALNLLERMGAESIELAFLIELSFLDGKKLLLDRGYKVDTVIVFENE